MNNMNKKLLFKQTLINRQYLTRTELNFLHLNFIINFDIIHIPSTRMIIP